MPNWDEMWASLKQEELRRVLVKCQLDRSSNSGSKPKEEEENVALASKGQQEQQKKKKDVSKIKCFRCGELSHYANQIFLLMTLTCDVFIISISFLNYIF